jgi:hypothetical protein
LVFIGFSPKFYIDIKNLANVSKTENYTFEEIAEEWEKFECRIVNFVTHCKTFFEKLISLK